MFKQSYKSAFSFCYYLSIKKMYVHDFFFCERTGITDFVTFCQMME